MREYIRREVKFVCMVTRCVFRGVIRSACTRREFQDAIDSLVDGFSQWEEKKKKGKREGFFYTFRDFQPFIRRRSTGNTTWNYVVELFNNTTTFSIASTYLFPLLLSPARENGKRDKRDIIGVARRETGLINIALTTVRQR